MLIDTGWHCALAGIPTHYAVALKYDDQKDGCVVAKGANLLAMKIRDLATESKVHLLQAPVLARAHNKPVPGIKALD